MVSSINTAVVTEGDEIVSVADRTSAAEHYPDHEHRSYDVLAPGLVGAHVHSPKNPSEIYCNAEAIASSDRTPDSVASPSSTVCSWR